VILKFLVKEDDMHAGGENVIGGTDVPIKNLKTLWLQIIGQPNDEFATTGKHKSK